MKDQSQTHLKKHQDDYRKQVKQAVYKKLEHEVSRDNIDWDNIIDQFVHHFEQTLIMEDPRMISEYMKWASTYLENRSLSVDVIQYMLETAKNVYGESLAEVIEEVIGNENLTEPIFNSDIGDVHSSFINDDNPLFEIASNYLQHLLNGNRHKARSLILDAVEQGTDIKDIYIYVFQPSQYEVGRLWQLNQVNIAQEHFCTAATQMIMSMLYEHIFSTERVDRSIVATTIGGDLHEIGIRMVADFFEINGWDTYYLGANIPNQELIDALLDNNADLLALSVTLMPFLSQTKTLIDEIRAIPELNNLVILTGGRPFILEPNLWKKIGADGYAINAQQAVANANNLLVK